MLKNNRNHGKVRELCSLFKEPSVIKVTYKDRIKMSPNLEYAVSVPIDNKTRAMVCGVAPQTFKIGQQIEVFRGNSKIRNIIFSSDSTLVLIANDEKLGVYSTISRRVVVVISADELQTEDKELAITSARFINATYNLHIVPDLTETDLCSEDFVWLNLGKGNFMFVDLRGWKIEPNFKPTKTVVSIKNWESFVN